MWLLNLHVSISILCFLTFFGFSKIFKENIIKNGWIEKSNKSFINKIIPFICSIFIFFIPILNLLITFAILIMIFLEKSKFEELNERYNNDK